MVLSSLLMRGNSIIFYKSLNSVSVREFQYIEMNQMFMFVKARKATRNPATENIRESMSTNTSSSNSLTLKNVSTLILSNLQITLATGEDTVPHSFSQLQRATALG